MNIRDRSGFTVIELLVVAVVGSVVVGSIYKILQTNQRTYTVQTAQVSNQQIVRAGLEVLSSELREVSSVGGDILGLGNDSIRVRSMRKLGLVCAVNQATMPIEVVIWEVGSTFIDGDSVYVFADNNPNTASDDSWLPATVSVAAAPTGACSDGTTGQRLQVHGIASDVIQLGGPIRAYDTYTYGLFWVAGDWHLARRGSNNLVEPLVGPLLPRSRSGLRFTYFDDTGSITATPTSVSRIDITLRAESDARGFDGNILSDSITTSIYSRN